MASRNILQTVSVNKSVLANLAAATAALSAGGAVVATRLVVSETDPVTLAFYRYLIAAVCLTPALPFVWPRSSISVGDIGKIAALGALFFGFFPWAFSASLQYTTAARGAIGLATLPIQTLVVAALFGREALTRNMAVSVSLAFTGIVVVFGPAALDVGDSNYLRGDVLMLLAAFAGAIYSVFSRTTLERYGPMFVTTLAMVFGVLTLLPLAFVGDAVTAMPTFTQKGLACACVSGNDGRRHPVRIVFSGLALVVAHPHRCLSHLESTLSNVSRSCITRRIHHACPDPGSIVCPLRDSRRQSAQG